MAPAPSPVPNPASTRRLGSIDAYRGFVMFLMMAEVLRFCTVAIAVPGNTIWESLCHHQSHVEWIGCVLHDMIQPSFSFLVGVALPFSLASRLARGQSQGRMAGHAVWRSLVLVFLGIFLRSIGHHQTNFTFEDTLSQIGLGYTFLFLLGMRSVRVQWIAFVTIVVGYWALFAAYPVRPDFDYPAVGVPADWPHLMSSFPAHWNKNSNPAWAFDVWFLNLFPRSEPFRDNGGGYATLSFIPTLATMILGLISGGILKRERPPWFKFAWLLVAETISLALGWGLGELSICPVVKRIWTPPLGPLLGRHLPFFPGVLLRGHRLAGLGALVVCPAGHRRQLDCRVLLQPPDRRFHQRQLQDAPRPGRLQFPGCCLRALSPWHGRPPGALAHPLLDVSPQAVLEDLRLQVSVRRAGEP